MQCQEPSVTRQPGLKVSLLEHPGLTPLLQPSISHVVSVKFKHPKSSYTNTDTDL